MTTSTLHIDPLLIPKDRTVDGRLLQHDGLATVGERTPLDVSVLVHKVLQRHEGDGRRRSTKLGTEQTGNKSSLEC